MYLKLLQVKKGAKMYLTMYQVSKKEILQYLPVMVKFRVYGYMPQFALHIILILHYAFRYQNDNF